MINPDFARIVRGLCVILTCMAPVACSIPEPPQSGNSIPAEYQAKHMLEGWWNDEKIVEEGRQLYLGNQKSNVNCAKCHGKTGRPVKNGARDFRDTSTMKKYSDSHLFWRISEGVPSTTMRAYKGKLSEDEIWKIIALIRTFGLKGLQYDPLKEEWISTGTGQSS